MRVVEKMGDLYLDHPLDLQKIQERKLAKLQAQVAAVESRMSENAALRRRLENMTDAEQDRSERIIEKLHSRNSVLKDEIDRIYQNKSPVSHSPSNQVINDVIARRTKEFSELQHEKALQYKYLMAEKQRLQAAQEKLREKRLAMHRIPTPEDGQRKVPRPPSKQSVHSDASYLHKAAMGLPNTVNRIWTLKEKLQADYVKRRKPYAGELGVESYEAWQIEDYVWIRQLVEEFVDNFIYTYVEPNYSYVEWDVQLAMQRAENVEAAHTVQALTERRVVQLVAEQILLQDTKFLMRQIAAELLHIHGTFKNIVDSLMMRETEYVSTGIETGRQADDPAYSLVNKTYFMLQHNRNKFKRDLWTHSQSLMTSEAGSQGQEERQEEPTDTDVELITYHHIHPSDLRKHIPSYYDPPPVKKKKELETTYRRRESEFWMHVEPSVTAFEIPRACQGVSCMKPSFDGNYMAIGTVTGDILLYDVHLEPWRLGRVAFNTARDNNGVKDLAWSLDGTRILSVHLKGAMEIWDTEGPAVDRTTARTLDLQPDLHGNTAKSLGLIGILSTANNDFTFQYGALAEAKLVTGKVRPLQAAFFPSLSLFGVQHSICTVLDNNDVIKIELEPLSAAEEKNKEEITYPEAPRIYQPTIYDASSGVNLVGQNLEAELFRQHQFPVLYLGFTDNLSRMVTVDSEGFINVWKYDLGLLSGLGYFVPERKYKLDLYKKMYTPSAADKPNVFFTDGVKSNPGKSPVKLAEERASVQRQLDKMDLGDPWHEETILNKDLVTSVYAPKGGGIVDSGVMFNVVVRHQRTKQLSAYLTRMYTPIKVKATKLLCVVPTPSGCDLVFVLLFPAYPPKEAHLTVLVLDLMTMKLRDLRRDIYLPGTLHNKLLTSPTISFTTSRVLGPTGADYLFVLMEGRIRGISLTSGNLVLRAEDPRKPSGFTGCIVDEQFMSVPSTTQAACTCLQGTIYVALFDKSKTRVQLLQLKDNNDYESRRLMWTAFRLSDHFRQVPLEMRVDSTTWTLGDLRHVEVDMRHLILDLVDERVFGIRPGDDPVQERQRIVKNKVKLYLSVQEGVDKRRLLGEGPE